MLAVACIATSAIGAADAAHVAVALSFPEGSLASMTQTSTGPVFTALPNTYVSWMFDCACPRLHPMLTPHPIPATLY